MADKKMLIVTGVLVVGAAATLLVDKAKAPRADARTGKSVVDGVALASVDHVTLKKADKTLNLVRAADQSWRLDSDKGFPADAAMLARLVDDLGRAKIESVVAEKKEALGAFGLEKPAVISLDGGGKNLLTLDVGDARKNGGQYIAFGDEAKAYLVGQNLAPAPDAEAWEHKVLLQVPKETVKSLAFTPLDGEPVVLSREKAGDPLKVVGLTGDEKESPAVQGADSLAVGVSFSKRYDLSNEEAKAALEKTAKTVITTFNGKVIEVKTGGTPKHFLAVSGTPSADELGKLGYFEVPEGVASTFARKRADFIAPPPAAPTAASDAAPGTSKQ